MKPIPRPAMRNVPFPQERAKCFVCGKPLIEPKSEFTKDFRVGIIDGVMLMVCEPHLEEAKIMCESIRTFMEMKHSAVKPTVETNN